MRLEEASWVGPTKRVLESRRSALPKLERETELLPEIIEALRKGKRSWAFEAARELQKKAFKIVQTGPISAVEERLAWAMSREIRCRATLEIGDGEEIRRDLLSQVPPIAPPPGWPGYEELEEAHIRFANLTLESEWDQFLLPVAFRASPGPDRYLLEWNWTGDASEAQRLTTGVRPPVPAPLFEETKAAAAEHLIEKGLEPFVEAGESAWAIRAHKKGARFDPDRPVSWRVKLRCAGPTHGAAMPGGGAWQGYGMEYWFDYDPASGDVELEVRGWNT